MNNNAKILAALGAGLAAGAILGVLFAPDKGKETRNKINQQGQKLANAVKEKINKGKEKLNTLKSDLDEKISISEEDFA